MGSCGGLAREKILKVHEFVLLYFSDLKLILRVGGMNGLSCGCEGSK